MRSKNALKIQELKTEISASLSEGYHFNLKAPNQIVTKGQPLLPISASLSLVQFPWPKGSRRNGQLQLYVCDNANTYCETHQIELNQSVRRSLKQSGKIKSSPRPPPETGEVHMQTILAQAKQSKNLVLLDFSARWCPACVRVESEILPTTEFKAAAKGFEVFRVDVDLFGNFPLSKKYRIKGLPTLLILDSEGHEIDRLLDFQALPRIKKFLKAATQYKQPLDELTLARRLLASDQPQEALKILETLTPAPLELAQAKITVAESEFIKDPLLKAKYIETLSQELAREPGSLRSLSWRTELVGLLGPEHSTSKRLVAEGKAFAETCLTDGTKLAQVLENEDLGEYAGYERLLVATGLGDLMEASGAPDEDAWKRAIEVGEGYHITAAQPGPALRFLLLLIQAKEYSKADTLSLALLQADPSHFDVRRRRLKILAGLNKHEEAAQLAQVLLREAEGRNQFWVAESLAKSYLALKKNKEALTLLDQYLSRQELNLDAMTKTKKSLESLRSKIVL